MDNRFRSNRSCTRILRTFIPEQVFDPTICHISMPCLVKLTMFEDGNSLLFKPLRCLNLQFCSFRFKINGVLFEAAQSFPMNSNLFVISRKRSSICLILLLHNVTVQAILKLCNESSKTTRKVCRTLSRLTLRSWAKYEVFGLLCQLIFR